MINFFNSLFWKISVIFLLILILVSAVYIYISVNTAEMYFQETRQKLDTEIAAHIADETDCFIDNEVNNIVLKEVFHNVMVINPSIEVYLLDTSGKILTYFAPNKVIKMEKIPLEPVDKFIDSRQGEFLLGADPRNPGEKKAFSAAKVYDDGKFMGYIYVILGGEEYENASQLVFGSYILRLGIRSMFIALIAAAVIGFISIGYITRNVRRMVGAINSFQEGNLNSRIQLKGKGELTQIASSFNDMADKIVDNIEEIKKNDELRRELIANVSHDLRTPISVIRGYVETVLIKDNNLSQEERKKYLETILSSSDRLLNLVVELFELSKLEARDRSPQTEPFSIHELVQDVYQKNKIIAEAKKIELRFEQGEIIPMIDADIGMMEKVLQNLIDNAIKFTPEKGLVRLALNKQEKSTIIIEVADTGPGIPQEHLSNIFDKYYQIKRVSENNYEGIGLGLAIVKKIVDLHNFQIFVDSEKNKGTSFRIIIPVK